MAAGDRGLANGVRVTVHGLVGDAAGLATLGIRSVELRVGFPLAGADPSTVEFKAWSHQLLPVDNAAAANSFAVPVDTGLALALEVETLSTERFETMLSTGRGPGQPKLRAGRYLIALGVTEFRSLRFGTARSEPMISFSVEPLA